MSLLLKFKVLLLKLISVLLVSVGQPILYNIYMTLPLNITHFIST